MVVIRDRRSERSRPGFLTISSFLSWAVKMAGTFVPSQHYPWYVDPTPGVKGEHRDLDIGNAKNAEFRKGADMVSPAHARNATSTEYQPLTCTSAGNRLNTTPAKESRLFFFVSKELARMIIVMGWTGLKKLKVQENGLLARSWISMTSAISGH